MKKPRVPTITPEAKGEVELKSEDDIRKGIVLEGWGPGLGQNLDEGDTLTYTYGQETYAPVSFNSFTVGPFSTTIKIRKDEGLQDAYLRAAKFLAQMFEAEFKIKRKQYFERLVESGKNEE